MELVLFSFSFIPCSSNIFTAVNDMAGLFAEVRFEMYIIFLLYTACVIPVFSLPKF